MVDKSINHDINPLKDLMNRSSKFKDSIKSTSTNKTLKENHNKQKEPVNESVLNELVEQLKILHERLDDIESKLDDKVILEESDGDAGEVKILVGKTLLIGNMKHSTRK